MMPERLFGVILAVYLISSTDCAVTLEHDSAATGNNFICGEKVKLTCKIEPLTSTMTWSKDSVSETQCFTAGNCLDTVKGSYQFSADVSIFEYYMTINPVAFTDAANFDCNDGSVNDAIDAVVKTIPTSATIQENSGTISVTTSCIYPKDEIEIKWYYVKVGETEAVEYTSQLSPTQTSASTSCTSGACTSGTDIVTVTSTFIYNGPAEGIDIQFRAVVSHTAAPSSQAITATTTVSYKMEAPATTSSQQTTSVPTNISSSSTSDQTTTENRDDGGTGGTGSSGGKGSAIAMSLKDKVKLPPIKEKKTASVRPQPTVVREEDESERKKRRKKKRKQRTGDTGSSVSKTDIYPKLDGIPETNIVQHRSLPVPPSSSKTRGLSANFEEFPNMPSKKLAPIESEKIIEEEEDRKQKKRKKSRKSDDDE